MALVPAAVNAELLRTPLGPSGTWSRRVHTPGGHSAHGRHDGARKGRLARALPGFGAALLVARHSGGRRTAHGAGQSAPSARPAGSAAGDAAALSEALRSLSRSPSLAHLLSGEKALATDFQAMEPLIFSEGDAKHIFSGDKTPISTLNTLSTRGDLSGLRFVTKGIDGGTLVLAVCSVDAGFACGVGLAERVSHAKQLAAQQLLQRLISTPQPSEELLHAAQGQPSVGVVDEAVRAFQETGHLAEVRMTVVRPVGTTWKASLKGVLQGQELDGSTKQMYPSRDEAVAAVGSIFLEQMRKVLGLPKSAPKTPRQWAESLRKKEIMEVMELTPLEDSEMQDTLDTLLNDDDEEEGLNEALTGALKRQKARMDGIREMTRVQKAERDAEEAAVVARRCWKVRTHEEENWRREEIKGKLPAENVREELSQALECNKCVVVSGGTGSGKSTQLPQFILDDWESWKVEHPEGAEEQGPLKPEVDNVVEVEYEETWYPCTVLEVAEDGSTITAKYHEGGDEEPDVDVKTRVRRGAPAWSREPPRIVVTQPRRIAAVSLATRVAWERFSKPGGEIGHAVRGDTVMPRSDTGTIEFCTVGTLLRRVVSDPELRNYNVVILDEVHERDLMTDFLLVLMKEVLEKRPDLRLVLMSATLDVQAFVEYLPGCHVVEVPPGPRFPVEEIHLENPWFKKFNQVDYMLRSEYVSREATAAQMGNLAAREFSAKPGTKKARSASPVLAQQIAELCSFNDRLRQAFDKFKGSRKDNPREWDPQDLIEFLTSQGIRPWNVDYDSLELTTSPIWWGSDSNDVSFVRLAETLILELAPDVIKNAPDDGIGVGSILCFLPGWAEIRALANRLACHTNLLLLKLHSSVPRDEQQQVFDPAPEGMVKVILATNIAESSVTINDVRIVIDSGLHRELSFDPKRRMSSLETVWICQSNAVQRKGRAGRVREGKVYRLYTSEQFNSVPWQPSPEMQRCNLAQTCLQTIALGRDPREFLAKAPDPPSVTMVEAGMAELSSIDAVSEGAPPLLLPVGQVLCRMPLEPLLGRAMMLGTLFGVPQMTAAVLAVSAGKSPFVMRPDKKAEAKAARTKYCDWSDAVAALRALNEYERLYRDQGAEAASRWAINNRLNYRRLLFFSKIKFQLLKDVQRSGLLKAADVEGMDPSEWPREGRGDSENEANDETPQKSEVDGAIFEAAQESTGLQQREWLDELRNSADELQDERLLMGILCSAYPTNIAVRLKPEDKKHKTSSGSGARIDRSSVNSNTDQEDANAQVSAGLQPMSWWLYSDLRMFNNQVTMTDTTRLSAWHVALFGGLHVQEQPMLELDNWIGVKGIRGQGDSMILKMRQEIRTALVWLAIAASWDSVAQACTLRAKALLRILGCALTEKPPAEADVKLVREWQLPESVEGATLQVEEDLNRDDVEERLWKKTVPELKVMLREMKATLFGKKRELVKRCADCLMQGSETTGESVEEFRGELSMA